MTTSEKALTRFSAILASVSALETLRERLCEAGRQMLEADGVVITSETVPDGPTTVAWTQLLSRRLESLQRTAGEGPLIDAVGSGRVTLGEFGDTGDHHWTRLRRELAELSFAGSMIAIPLRSELDLRGALLAHRAGRSLRTDATVARFLGAAIGTAVLQDPRIGAQSHVMAEILTDREIVHQATSLLQIEAGVHYEDALALLRALAFTRGEELGALAKNVVDRGFALSDGQ